MNAKARADAALAALEAEAARGAGYAWPDRSCVSLIEAVCAALGGRAPDYAAFRTQGERQAARTAIARYGSLGSGHQQILQAAGWSKMPLEAPVLACDAVSCEGRVVMADGTEYAPRRAEAHWTGVVGPEGLVWGWTPHGLSTVAQGAVSHVTRLKGG